MTASPSVSVLMAVFNGERYLRQAMDSIASQSFRDFEFIIIDDGSTDGTIAILREYAAADPRINLVSRPNQGLTASLNEGLGMARGEFLARMDADDVALPARFEKQLDYMRQNPDCVLVGSRVLLIDPEGMPIRETCQEQTHAEIDFGHLNCRWPVVHPTVMLRTEAVRRIGGYRDKYNTLEDLDLFLRLAEVGKLANLPQVLLNYRQHFGSVTHQKYQQQARIRQEIFDQTQARRGLDVRPFAPPPPDKPMKSSDQHRSWAWAALKAGNISTARKHALATMRKAPLALESWRVLGCALRGR